MWKLTYLNHCSLQVNVCGVERYKLLKCMAKAPHICHFFTSTFHFATLHHCQSAPILNFSLKPLSFNLIPHYRSGITTPDMALSYKTFFVCVVISG